MIQPLDEGALVVERRTATRTSEKLRFVEKVWHEKSKGAEVCVARTFSKLMDDGNFLVLCQVKCTRIVWPSIVSHK